MHAFRTHPFGLFFGVSLVRVVRSSLAMVVLAGCYATSAAKDTDTSTESSTGEGDSDSANGDSENTDSGEVTTLETDSADSDHFAIHVVVTEDDDDWLMVVDETYVSENLEEVPLEVVPLVSDQDIIAYDWDTHRVYLTSDTAERLMVQGLGMDLQAPVPAVVMADGAGIYIAVFWPLFFSSLPSCPALSFFEGSDETPPHIAIGFYDSWQGEAINDLRIYEALEAAGLLSSQRGSDP